MSRRIELVPGRFDQLAGFPTLMPGRGIISQFSSKASFPGRSSADWRRGLPQRIRPEKAAPWSIPLAPLRQSSLTQLIDCRFLHNGQTVQARGISCVRTIRLHRLLLTGNIEVAVVRFFHLNWVAGFQTDCLNCDWFLRVSAKQPSSSLPGESFKG